MTAPSPSPSTPVRNHWRGAWPVALLLIATLIVYAQTVTFDFINYDDDVHVYANRHVNTGLSLENLRWAFGVHGPSQWHPLAWISHQIDAQLFGAQPGDGSAGGHHAVNLLLHLISTVLAYLVFVRLTAHRLAAIFVAGMFALHPLSVESVAWVSERRNTLCAVFFLLALLAYTNYVERPDWRRYLIVQLWFIGGLMAKPMIVTLPCVLLLLDFWPLGRTRWLPPGPMEATAPPSAQPSSLGWLVVEKLPMFALAGVASYLTILCQESAGVISSVAALPLSVRIANAFAAYAHYLRTLVCPSGLSVFYPHPGLNDADPLGVLLGPAAVGVVLLLMVTGLAIVCWRRFPALIVGWLWFLGMLVPMIGLVQVGEQQYADRYMYLPGLGLFLIGGMLIAELDRRGSVPRRRLAAGVAILLAVMASLSTMQTSLWENSLTLFKHAIAVNPRNHYAYLNAGVALSDAGETNAAIEHYRAALEVKPNYALAHYNLGVLLHDSGDLRGAAQHYNAALHYAPRMDDAWVRFGILAGELGQLNVAEQSFRQALSVNPSNEAAHVNLALVLENRGDLRTATEHFRQALQLAPQDERARQGLKRVGGSAP